MISKVNTFVQRFGAPAGFAFAAHIYLALMWFFAEYAGDSFHTHVICVASAILGAVCVIMALVKYNE